MKIRISSVVNDSIVDGVGFRLAVFTQGCTHNCEGCHNQHTHDLKGGKLVDVESIVELMRENPLLDGITITGGEPFLQSEQCGYLAKMAHSLNLNVWTYTGYTYEELMTNEAFKPLLDNTDILIDGKFQQELRTLELRFKGSKNQRIIDLNQTRETGEIILWC
ncbi:MAG: anaerobic ribonucleoside-triphosphate reductase activating protein [Anaerotignaceae bacterium]